MEAGHLATVNSMSENDQMSSAIQELVDSKAQIKVYHPWIGFRKGGEERKGLFCT